MALDIIARCPDCGERKDPCRCSRTYQAVRARVEADYRSARDYREKQSRSALRHPYVNCV